MAAAIAAATFVIFLVVGEYFYIRAKKRQSLLDNAESEAERKAEEAYNAQAWEQRRARILAQEVTSRTTFPQKQRDAAKQYVKTVKTERTVKRVGYPSSRPAAAAAAYTPAVTSDTSLDTGTMLLFAAAAAASDDRPSSDTVPTAHLTTAGGGGDFGGGGASGSWDSGDSSSSSSSSSDFSSSDYSSSSYGGTD